jgi:cysteine desulfurase
MIYLDYQATTPLAPEARAAMLPWLGDAEGANDDRGGFANPSSQYRIGRAASVAVEMARDAVAALLPPGGRVIFTSGATEALNWALQRGVAIRPGGVSGSSIEHAAALQCLDALDGGTIAVDGDGVAIPPIDDGGLVPDSADARFALCPPVSPADCHPPIASQRVGSVIPDNGIIALMLVNNEIGTIQPVAAYAEAAHARGSLLLCDAVQGYGRMVIPEGPDMIAISAHKIHGPKGIGALWLRDGVDLPPLLLGGGQEMGLRSGTVSPALVAGFGAAATLAAERMAADAAHVAHLWDMAMEEMAGWTVNGSALQRYRGNLNIRKEGVNATRLLSDARQIAFSLGSACGSGSGRTSHVLRAIGLSEGEARSSIRLGWGRYTSESALREGLRAIKAAAALQERAP